LSSKYLQEYADQKSFGCATPAVVRRAQRVGNVRQLQIQAHETRNTRELAKAADVSRARGAPHAQHAKPRTVCAVISTTVLPQRVCAAAAARASLCMRQRTQGTRMSEHARSARCTKQGTAGGGRCACELHHTCVSAASAHCVAAAVQNHKPVARARLAPGSRCSALTAVAHAPHTRLQRCSAQRCAHRGAASKNTAWFEQQVRCSSWSLQPREAEPVRRARSPDSRCDLATAVRECKLLLQRQLSQQHNWYRRWRGTGGS
jgi:hypothetical protein